MTNVIEIWKDIPTYEGIYQASNLGNVKSIKRNKQLSKAKSNGYLNVTLFKKGIRRVFVVHRIIAFAFHGISNLPVDHINRIKTDNRPENLRYLTHRENSTHHYIQRNEYTGTSWAKRQKSWHSQITINKKVIHLGYFKSRLDAHKAYQDALKSIS